MFVRNPQKPEVRNRVQREFGKGGTRAALQVYSVFLLWGAAGELLFHVGDKPGHCRRLGLVLFPDHATGDFKGRVKGLKENVRVPVKGNSPLDGLGNARPLAHQKGCVIDKIVGNGNGVFGKTFPCPPGKSQGFSPFGKKDILTD